MGKTHGILFIQLFQTGFRPSPDGKKLIFIRYLADQDQAHPFGCDVQIMLHDLNTSETRAVTEVFYGGQGTLNVPCWSPDSTEFAFVSYEKIVR
ncbi:MAG TPA: hypothetical protein VIZ65_13345 [Cellvibrionaceae bacterium]